MAAAVVTAAATETAEITELAIDLAPGSLPEAHLPTELAGLRAAAIGDQVRRREVRNGTRVREAHPLSAADLHLGGGGMGASRQCAGRQGTTSQEGAHGTTIVLSVTGHGKDLICVLQLTGRVLCQHLRSTRSIEWVGLPKGGCIGETIGTSIVIPVAPGEPTDMRHASQK